VAVTLYCQECGNVLREVDREAALERPIFLRCDFCGCLHKPGGMTTDELFAWLMFPPDNAAA
jgi:uncharacterized Zn finger protein